MFLLQKEFRFEASHQLLNHDGKCARLHGHSWRMKVYLQGETLQSTGPKAGMLVDYGDISREVRPLIEEKLDHYHLNDTLGVASPTSEFIAQWVFNQLLPRFGELLYAVRVYETCTSGCTFVPSDDDDLSLLYLAERERT